MSEPIANVDMANAWDGEEGVWAAFDRTLVRKEAEERRV